MAIEQRGETQEPAGSARADLAAMLPLLPAVAAFGASFGLLAAKAGLGRAATVAMSLTTFAGSAQLAAASVLDAGGTATAAIVAAVLLNARYAAIGASVAHALRGGRVVRLLAAQLVVDESWAIGRTPSGRVDARRMLVAGGGLYLAWNAGTIVGVFGGGLIGDPSALGLDAAFPALFLALLVPQAPRGRPLAAALLGGAIALALLPLTPAGVPIVAAAAACLVGVRR